MPTVRVDEWSIAQAVGDLHLSSGFLSSALSPASAELLLNIKWIVRKMHCLIKACIGFSFRMKIK